MCAASLVDLQKRNKGKPQIYESMCGTLELVNFRRPPYARRIPRGRNWNEIDIVVCGIRLASVGKGHWRTLGY
jgi:hypothetical protein